MRKYLDRSLCAIMILVIVFAMMGSAYFLFSTSKLPSEKTFINHNGITYLCQHYTNGDMDCNDVDDPNVGGGKDTQ